MDSTLRTPSGLDGMFRYRGGGWNNTTRTSERLQRCQCEALPHCTQSSVWSIWHGHQHTLHQASAPVLPWEAIIGGQLNPLQRQPCGVWRTFGFWGQIHHNSWWGNQPMLWLHGIVYLVNYPLSGGTRSAPSLRLDIGPLINLGTQHDGRSARTWMKRV